MNRFGAKSFVIAVGMLLSTICPRLAAEGNDSGLSTAVALNVRDFSAKGDGKTDDSLAFTNALNALGEKGGTLLVPSGIYLVGELKIGSNTTLRGLGVPRPILVKSPHANDILDLTGRANWG